MRDRLIELLMNTPKLPITMGGRANGKTYQTASNIADHLLANGVVVPPVSVGDTVYVITSDSPTRIEKTRVSQIKIKVKENSRISYRISAPCVYDDWGEAHWTFCEFDFGKTVFLTREEAEAKLKEGDE